MWSSSSVLAKHGRLYLFGGARRGRGRRIEVSVPAERIPLTSVRPVAGTTTSSDNDTDVDSSPLHAVTKPESNDVKRTRWSVSQCCCCCCWTALFAIEEKQKSAPRNSIRRCSQWQKDNRHNSTETKRLREFYRFARIDYMYGVAKKTGTLFCTP